jgi:hypothetical protein
VGRYVEVVVHAEKEGTGLESADERMKRGMIGLRSVPQHSCFGRIDLEPAYSCFSMQYLTMQVRQLDCVMIYDADMA